MTALDEHRGVLCEADYTFTCWTTCSCGWWRSRSYRGYGASAHAWIAFYGHLDEQAGWEQAWDEFAEGER